jgi:hypothetical protein
VPSFGLDSTWLCTGLCLALLAYVGLEGKNGVLYDGVGASPIHVQPTLMIDMFMIEHAFSLTLCPITCKHNMR